MKINKYSIYVLLAAVLWGSAGIFVRSATDVALTEMQLVFGRAILTSLILAVIIFIKDKSLFKVRLKDLFIFASAGLFSIVLFNYSYYTTMRLATLSVAAVLLYTAPFFVVIFSIFLFSEKLNIKKAVSCLVAFLGCCFVSNVFDSANRISGKALFFGLLTGFGYALYTVFGNILLKRKYKTLTVTFYIFLFAALFTVPFINVANTVVYAVKNPKALLIVFLMALFNTVLPYLLYTTGLLGVDASAAPIIAMVEPVVATIIGAVLFKETLTFSGVLGIILVLVSVVILNSQTVRLKANAKINLTLSINGKREDGYHLIDTIMQNISLCDYISVKRSSKISVKCKDSDIENEKNIAYKSAELFFKETGVTGGAAIKIKKQIPKAAGLGGGSADAAAVLLALDKIYNTNLSTEKLEEIALGLGADVPFFIEGGTKRAEGIGEKLTTLTPLKNGYFVLAKADSKPSTAEMYKRLDSENHSKPDVDSAVKAIETEDIIELSKLMDNSFISVWNNSETKKQLSEFDALCVSLSGSGPTWFALFEDKKKAKTAYETLKKQDIECYLVKPQSFAVSFE